MLDGGKYDTVSFRAMSSREGDYVATGLRVFGQLSTYRTQAFASHWEEVSELIEPAYRNTFVFGNYNTPGQKKTDRQIDATGMLANTRFAAICDSLMTPRNQIYQRITAGGPNAEYILKDRKTQLWFEQVTNLLFYYRNLPEANFAAQNHSNYRSLGAFGNHAMFVDELDDLEIRGLRYRSIPLGEIFVSENHQGRIDRFVRWFRFTARQADQKWPGQLPPNLHTAYNQDSEQVFDFLHCVQPRDDYDPQRLDARGKRWSSYYICLSGRCLMFKKGEDMEGGYRTFPLAFGRFDQAPGEVYGRGWAMALLPALKTLNAQKKVFLRAGHLALDPVKIMADDGIVGFVNRPGAMNPGGVTSDGKPLVHAMPVGDVQIGKEMMQEERSLINDGALVTLFQILVKSPTMSATEVIERASEKGILLAPTMGRQLSEYLGTMTPRELSLLEHMNLLPPMPPRLREAQGQYHIMYDNPLSRMAKAQESAGFMRTLESVHQIAANTGDPSVYDPFDFDVAVPAIATQNATPASWMASEQKIAQKRQNRAKMLAKEQAIKALPNQAAMISAHAKAVAAGAEQPQQQQEQQEQQPQQM